MPSLFSGFSAGDNTTVDDTSVAKPVDNTAVDNANPQPRLTMVADPAYHSVTSGSIPRVPVVGNLVAYPAYHTVISGSIPRVPVVGNLVAYPAYQSC